MRPYDDDGMHIVYAPPEYMGVQNPPQDTPENGYDDTDYFEEPITAPVYAPPEYMGVGRPGARDADADAEPVVYPYSHAFTAPEGPDDPDNPIGDLYGGPELSWDNRDTGMDTVYGGPRGRGLAAAIRAILSRITGNY